MNASEMFAKLGYVVDENHIGERLTFDTYITYINDNLGVKIIFERFDFTKVEVTFFNFKAQVGTSMVCVYDTVLKAVVKQIEEIEQMYQKEKGVK